MREAKGELAIQDKTGGPVMALPFLLIMEFCFVGLFCAGLKGNIQDAPIYSLYWWVIEIASGAIAIALAVIILKGLRVSLATFGQPAYLRINSEGIWLPYESRPIVWQDIQSYYVKDQPWMKGGAMHFLYVSRARRHWLQKNVMILGRKAFDNEDMRNCMAWIDRFLPH